MKAVGITGPGGPEVLSVIDRPVRGAAAGEVRVAVRAATVNPTDISLRKGDRGGELPRPWTPGMDASGTIESIGEGVDRFRVGDRVIAALTPRRPEGGAQAELVVVPAASVVPAPGGISLEQAATLPMNGLTAWLGLDELGLPAGATLAVTGASGLLGSYVVAIAKQRGLRVIADTRPGEDELVRGFGADEVVPRGEEFFDAVRAIAPDGVDGLFDTAVLLDAAFPAIRDGGTMAVIRGWTPERTPRGIIVKQVFVGSVLERTEWLEQLRDWASSGQIKLREIEPYRPQEAAAAQARIEAGGMRTRPVIIFAEP